MGMGVESTSVMRSTGGSEGLLSFGSRVGVGFGFAEGWPGWLLG
jgi:hypothetical protein